VVCRVISALMSALGKGKTARESIRPRAVVFAERTAGEAPRRGDSVLACADAFGQSP